jgi:hypothetical protein
MDPVQINSYSFDVTSKLPFLGKPRGEVFFGTELELEVDKTLRSSGSPSEDPSRSTEIYTSANLEDLLECAESCTACQRELARRNASTEPKPVEVEKPAIQTFQDLLDAVGETLVDFALFKHDGTINYGFECVTAPASLMVHHNRWAKLFKDRLDLVKYLSSPSNCGMHVHMSKKPLTVDMRAAMYTFINEPKHAKFIHKIAGRGSTSYSTYIPKPKQDIEITARKYEALNISPKNTIEMRIFASTTNFETLMKNLEFCGALCHWVQTMDKALLDTPTLTGFLEGVDRNRKTYPALTTFLESEKEL